MGSSWLGVTPDVSQVHGHAIDFVDNLTFLHAKVHENLKSSSVKYKASIYHHRHDVRFGVGDHVWAVLTKDCFPPREYNKLNARKIGPLEILEKINSNPYRVRLPPHICSSDVFNVKHLTPYVVHDDIEDSKTNLFLTRVT